MNKKSTLQNFPKPPNSPHFNDTQRGWLPSELLLLPHTSNPRKAPRLLRLLLSCTSTKEQKPLLKTAVAAAQETAAPKHIAAPCKRKAALFVFVTTVVLGADPTTEISDV